VNPAESQTAREMTLAVVDLITFDRMLLTTLLRGTNPDFFWCWLAASSMKLCSWFESRAFLTADEVPDSGWRCR